jgi:hypothetical protein
MPTRLFPSRATGNTSKRGVNHVRNYNKTENIVRFFSGVIEECADNLNNGRWGTEETFSRGSLHSSRKGRDYILDFDGARLAVDAELFDHIEELAIKEGVPLFVADE